MQQNLTLTFCKVNFRWKKTSPEFELRRTYILSKWQKKKGCISAVRIRILSLLMQIYNIFPRNANVKIQINNYPYNSIVWLSTICFLLKRILKVKYGDLPVMRDFLTLFGEKILFIVQKVLLRFFLSKFLWWLVIKLYTFAAIFRWGESENLIKTE